MSEMSEDTEGLDPVVKVVERKKPGPKPKPKKKPGPKPKTRKEPSKLVKKVTPKITKVEPQHYCQDCPPEVFEEPCSADCPGIIDPKRPIPEIVDPITPCTPDELCSGLTAPSIAKPILGKIVDRLNPTKLDETPVSDADLSKAKKIGDAPKAIDPDKVKCPSCGSGPEVHEHRPWEHEDQIKRFRCKLCGTFYQVALGTGEVQS